MSMINKVKQASGATRGNTREQDRKAELKVSKFYKKDKQISTVTFNKTKMAKDTAEAIKYSNIRKPLVHTKESPERPENLASNSTYNDEESPK